MIPLKKYPIGNSMEKLDMKHLIIIFVFCFLQQAIAQEGERVNIFIGPVFNQSSDAWNNTTGLGLFIEGAYFVNEKIRLGARFEPTALAYGVAVFPGGCEFEHPRYPGFNSCREGANFLFNNYLKGEYMLGARKYTKKNRRKQAYIGTNIILLMHNRYIITSREPGNWKDTQKLVTNLGIGIRLGVLLGKFDLSAAYNKAGKDFRGFVGLNLGYSILDW